MSCPGACGLRGGGVAARSCSQKYPAKPKRILTNVLSMAWLLSQASAGIFPYENMELQSEHLMYRESGMFAPGKGFLEIGAGGGDGESFIRLTELSFQANGTGLCFVGEDGEVSDTCSRKTGHVEVAIFEQHSFGHVGVSVNDSKYYCCDDSAVRAGACYQQQLGTALLSDAKDIWWHKKLDLPPGVPTSLDHEELYRVAETGMYIVLVANCDPATGSIVISGHSEWKNPYGYLPGQEYGYLPFFFVLAAVYLALGVTWMIVCMVYTKDLLAIQMWTSLVLFLGMVETGAQYFGYREWNLEGTRAPGAQAFAVIFGAAKRSLSLSMILMVCMGYGVVRPSLGKDIHKIMAMALVYFISSALWVGLTKGADAGDQEFATRASINAAAMLVFVNAGIMFGFFYSIMQSIVGVIQHLRARSQTAKLALYLHFRRVLVASFVFAVAWLVFSVVRSSEIEEERHWESNWTIDAIWEVVYLAVLVAVCFLLRPSMNTQRFSYAAVPPLGGKHDEEDGGDILLQSIDDEDAEYGGSLEEGEDRADEFIATGGRKTPRPNPKKANQD